MGTESLVSPLPVMNSLVSETKVICNDSIPNPITPVPMPILPADSTKSITILNGTHMKINKGKIVELQNNKKNNQNSQKDEISMNTDPSTDGNESSLSPSEPMDCNSTPNASPSHIHKCCSSNEDVAMIETSVSFTPNFIF